MVVTAETPFIKINNKNIACLLDAPHLIKSVRNCLLKGNIKIGNEIVSWKIIEKIYAEEEHSILKSCFKLTEAHIRPNSFEKLSVKLAVQVFSRNISTAIELAVSLNIFNSEELEIALSTANFFKKINDLFDNLNSVARFSENPQRNAISEDSGTEVLNNLNSAKDWIQSWRHLGKMKRPYCFDGLIQAISGILGLWNSLKSNQKFLITFHLNADCLENSISILRRNKGSYERNPSALRLCRNLKQMAFQDHIPPSSSGYNVSNSSVLLDNSMTAVCQDQKNEIGSVDEDNNFLNMLIAESGPESNNVTFSAKEADGEYSGESDNENDDSSNNIQLPTVSMETNATAYIAGYIAHKMCKRTSCTECKRLMLDEEQKDLESGTLIKLRAFPTKSTTSEYGSLTLPSAEFFKYISNLYKYFTKTIDDIKHERNLLRKLLNNLEKDKRVCENHFEDITKFSLLLFIRFYSRKMNKILQNKSMTKSDKIRILKGR